MSILWSKLKRRDHAKDALMNAVEQNFRRALEQVAEAIEKCGRHKDSVRVIGVTKYVSEDLTRQLVLAGCRDLGESRPQSLWQKHASIADSHSGPHQLSWHLIGHLQRNKVAKTIPLIDWLHSLDSLRLAQTVHLESLKRTEPLNVLVEVNVSSDASKTGLQASQVPKLMEDLLHLDGFKIRGLMAMSTENATQDQALREFTQVRQLRDQLQSQFGSAIDLSELSMGMSGDFLAAIAAGSTMVRLGSILWK